MTVLLMSFFLFLMLGCVKNGRLFFVVAFPGIVIHELAHWGVAVLLGGRPDPIVLVPSKAADGRWILGSVTFSPTWWNAGFVALAPLYVLPIVGWVLYLGLEGASMVELVVSSYVLACLAWGCWPSAADWQIAATRPLGSLVVLLGLGMFVTSLVNNEPSDSNLSGPPRVTQPIRLDSL